MGDTHCKDEATTKGNVSAGHAEIEESLQAFFFVDVSVFGRGIGVDVLEQEGKIGHLVRSELLGDDLPSIFPEGNPFALVGKGQPILGMLRLGLREMLVSGGGQEGAGINSHI